ncbi:protein tyrosine phosphatase domain-containing protein 1-like isoform X2 [Prorops nasuta]|uniref:protein tyrosine phosphatase domain-containing protein 1-like isoform X2 n=1 Tax=Prorops nasuta TaxID=863751 RepID=UPI0034CF98F5
MKIQNRGRPLTWRYKTFFPTVYYYNFAWKDYGDATVSKLLDMVKVVAFAVQEGRVAIHCHAGLGRTGVLIACYLIYSLRVRASDAIRFVRIKRPSAIQTRGQILCIQEFEHFLLPQMTVYHLTSVIGNHRPCSLAAYLRKQHTVLHGYEQRTFKYIPKIIFIICERILQLCDCQEDNTPSEIKYVVSNIPFTQMFIGHMLDQFRDVEINMRHSYSWADSLADSSYELSSCSKVLASSQGSSRGTTEDMIRLGDVFCPSPDAPSCYSAFPEFDDTCVDDVLGDGIHDQDLYDNDCYKEIQSHLDLKEINNEDFDIINPEEAMKALLHDESLLTEFTKKRLHSYQVDLNTRSSAWRRLELETDLNILSGLLYEWLETLKYPVLAVDSLSYIVVWSSKPHLCLEKLDVYKRYLVEYLLRFVCRLRPMTTESQSLIIKRLMAALTQQAVRIGHSICPSNKHFSKLRSGTAGKLNEFFLRLINLIVEVNTQELVKHPWSSKWDLTESGKTQRFNM